jgi:hypothetical protein
MFNERGVRFDSGSGVDGHIGNEEGHPMNAGSTSSGVGGIDRGVRSHEGRQAGRSQVVLVAASGRGIISEMVQASGHTRREDGHVINGGGGDVR